MANTIFKLKRSSVSGKVPNTSTLAIGELALNITDHKLFSTDGSHVFEIGSNVSIIRTGDLAANIAYFSNLTISDHATLNANLVLNGSLRVSNSYGNTGLFLTTNGSAVYWGDASGIVDIPHINQSEISNGIKTQYVITGGYDANNLSVFVNGVRMSAAEANISSGSNVSFSVAPANGAIIDFFGYKLDGSDGTHVKYNFTGDGTTNTFNVYQGFDSNRINVFLNGIRAANSEINTSSGNSIIFSVAPANGVNIDIFGIKNLNPIASYVSDVFTANGSTTIFNSSQYYSPNRLSVYLNGVRMTNSEANTASGTEIVFSTAPVNGAIIETFGIYTPLEYAIANADVTYTWTNTHTFTNTVIFSTAPVFPSNTAAVWNTISGTNGQMVSVSDASPNGAMAFWSHGSGWKYIANNQSII